MSTLPLCQCGFCSHINPNFLRTCEFCGELLNATISLVMSNIFARHSVNPWSVPSGVCNSCGRSLLPLTMSCTFCNARWNATPVARPRVPHISIGHQIRQHLHDQFVTVDSIEVSAMNLLYALHQAQDEEPTPLSMEARQQVVRPVTADMANSQFDTCPVCLDTFSQGDTTSIVQLVCCNNLFHRTCLDTWFNTRSTCPMCRNSFSDGDTNVSGENVFAAAGGDSPRSVAV